MKKLLQVGTDTYAFNTEAQQIAAIKMVIVYHQGQSSTIKIIDDNDLYKNQRAYISYQCMEAATTTADEDMNDIAFRIRKQAIYMGEKACKEWLEEELGS